MSASYGINGAVSAVTGYELADIFTGLLKLVITVVEKTVVFRSTLRSVQEALEKLGSTIERIKENDSKLNRRDGMKGLKDLLEKGHALVKKCERVGKWNPKRPLYTCRLEKLTARIKEFIDFDIPLYTAVTASDGLVQATLGAELGGKILDVVEHQTVVVEATSAGVERQAVVGDMIYEEVTQHGEMLGDVHRKVTEIQESLNRTRESVSACSMSFSLPPGALDVRLKIPRMEIKARWIMGGVPLAEVSAPVGYGNTTLATTICPDQQVGARPPAITLQVSIATGAESAISTNKLDQIFTALFEASYLLIQKNFAIRDATGDIVDVFNKMEPKIREIANYDAESDQPNEIQDLVDLGEASKMLNKKCESVSAINIFEGTKYTIRLEKFQADFVRHVRFNLEVQMAAVGTETLSYFGQGAAAATKAWEVAERHERVGAEILQKMRQQGNFGNLIAHQVIHTEQVTEEINSRVKGVRAEVKDLSKKLFGERGFSVQGDRG